jgi:hypothetical protein
LVLALESVISEYTLTDCLWLQTNKRPEFQARSCSLAAHFPQCLLHVCSIFAPLFTLLLTVPRRLVAFCSLLFAPFCALLARKLPRKQPCCW